jgi:hypothetical protein
MCFGGDSPQQPVQPAPYPWAELDVKDARAPTATPHGNETDAAASKTPSAAGAAAPSTGASYGPTASGGAGVNDLKM